MACPPDMKLEFGLVNGVLDPLLYRPSAGTTPPTHLTSYGGPTDEIAHALTADTVLPAALRRMERGEAPADGWPSVGHVFVGAKGSERSKFVAVAGQLTARLEARMLGGNSHSCVLSEGSVWCFQPGDRVREGLAWLVARKSKEMPVKPQSWLLDGSTLHGGGQLRN